MSLNSVSKMGSGVKRKRIVLSIKQKLDIINKLEKGEKVSVIAQQYNVGKSSVMDIKMKKDALLNYASSHANVDNMNQRKIMKPAYNKELDDALHAWYLNMKKSGKRLHGEVICDKALELNNAQGGPPCFKASGRWLKNFKLRHGLDFPLTVNGNMHSEEKLCVDNNNSLSLGNTDKNNSLTNINVATSKIAPRAKRKRIVLSLKQKLDIINRLNRGESACNLAREYNIGQSSVKDIKTSQEAILNYVSSFASLDNINRRKTMKNAYNKKLDQSVYEWCIETLRSGQVLSGPMICDKALEFNKLSGGSSDFKASSGWLQNFKSRHGLFFQGNETDFDCTNNSNNDSEMYPDIYFEEGAACDLVSGNENVNSNQSGDSLPSSDVVLTILDDDCHSVEEISEHSEFASRQILNAFDSVISWAGLQEECTSSDILNLQKLRDLACMKAMSVSFSSDDSETINRKIVYPDSERRDVSFSLEEMYEVQRCVEWIKSNAFSKVALQFPDGMLNDSTAITLLLGDLTDAQYFILGDTSFGSCCVDEIAAEHASADAIIHFGHSCLSTNKRLPTLFIFGKLVIDIQDAIDAFMKLFPDKRTCVIILYEVMYSYAIDSISMKLKGYENVVISQLEIPSAEIKPFRCLENSENLTLFSKCCRYFGILKVQTLNNYSIFYVGSRAVTLTNFMLSLKNCTFYTYNPIQKTARLETLDVNKHLKRRYYYIEKAKDAKIIGILVGTLGVSNYLSIIKHLKELITQSGKKSYTLVVGKLNNAKLANFAEIEVFVNVACVEASLIESREFYQSIITPYELEMALNQARTWTGDYITDFSDILPGAANYVPQCPEKGIESDISLVTGKIRYTGLTTMEDNNHDAETALVTRNDMKISAVHAQGAGEFLSQRSWQGLEQKLGETPIPGIEPGQRGIASKYDEEKDISI